jgi:hypothetical protein
VAALQSGWRRRKSGVQGSDDFDMNRTSCFTRVLGI